MILVSTAVASLGFGFHFCDKVPITNRWRLIWPNAEFDGAVGWAETWESTPERPILRKEAPEVATIQKILNRLLDTDRLKGLVINLFVCEVLVNPNASAIAGSNGGRIFFDVGNLLQGENPEEVAGILAHELAHIIARHSIERTTGQTVAEFFARMWSFRGLPVLDLSTRRMQEYEADHIALVLLAEAGIDPRTKVYHQKRISDAESALLDGRENMPEFLNTHPSAKNRTKQLHVHLPVAKVIFEKRKGAKIIVEEWDTIRQHVQNRWVEAIKIPDFSRLTPPQLLLAVLQEVLRLSATVELLQHQMNQKEQIVNGNDIKPEQVSDCSA